MKSRMSSIGEAESMIFVEWVVLFATLKCSLALTRAALRKRQTARRHRRKKRQRLDLHLMN